VIPGYDPKAGPGIAVPDTLHDKIPNNKGPFVGTPDDLMNETLDKLRAKGAPEDKLKELVELFKQFYPGVLR
jgi:hypothetical protein